MKQEYQDVKLTFKQWDAFRAAATSSPQIKSPHDLDVAVNYFLRLWRARNEWVEQEIEMDMGDEMTERIRVFCSHDHKHNEGDRPVGDPTPLKDLYTVWELEGLLHPRLEGEWTLPTVGDVPLTKDGMLADPDMLRAWKDYCCAT